MGLGMYPLVYVINKESVLSFIHLENGEVGIEMALGTSGSWPGALRVGPPVKVYTGRRNSARRRGRSQSVDNAWLPSDPWVKRLSGPLSLEAEFQGGRAASYLSARQGLDFISREAQRRHLPPGFPLRPPLLQPRGHARVHSVGSFPITREPEASLDIPGKVSELTCLQSIVSRAFTG